MLKYGKKLSAVTGVAGFLVMFGAVVALEGGSGFINGTIVGIMGLVLMYGSRFAYLYLKWIEIERSQKRGKEYRQMLMYLENEKSA